MSKGILQVTRSAVRYPFIIALAMTTACSPKGDALYARAEQSLNEGKPRAAVIDLKNLVASDPKNARARALLGRALVGTGETQQAAIELQKAKDLGASAESLLVPECQVLAAQGAFDKVLTQCSPDAAPASARFELQVALGQALLGLDRAADAKVQFEAALKARPASLDALLGLARAAYATDGIAAAKSVLDRAPPALKEDAKYWMVVGSMNGSAGNLADAERAFSEAVAKADTGGDGNERLVALGALAEVQMRSGKVKEAMATGEKLASAAPNNPLVKQLRGQILAAGGDLGQARTLLEEAVAAMPGNYQAQTLLGMVNLQQGNLGQAEQQFSNVVAHEPGNVQAQKLLAETRSKLQTPEEILAGLKPALTQATADPSILAMAGRLSLASGDREQALTYLAQAAQQPGKSNSADVQLEIAAGYLMAGDLDQAVKLLEEMPQGGTTATQREYLLLLALLRKGETAKAVSEAKSLVEKSGTDPVVRNLAGAVFVAAGQRDAGREQFGEALKLKPNDPSALVNLGRLDLAEGKVADAEREFGRVLEVDPKSMVATVGLAVIAAGKGDRKATEKWLKKAAVDHPDALEAQLALAQYYLGERDFAQAQQVIDAAAKKTPGSAAIANARGLAMLGLKDMPQAIASFKDAAAKAPKDYRYPLNLARAYLVAGDLGSALGVVDGVLASEPKLAPALALGAAAAISQGGDLGKASGYVERLQRLAPDAAATFALEGDLAMAQKRYREARDFYSKANAKGANGVLVMAEYRAALLAGAQKPEQVLETWVADHPDDIAAVTVLAEARQRAGDEAGAIALYEQVLRKLPDNAALLNNLAVLYEAKGDPRAIEVAEKAYKAAPKQPAIQDTYGWILLQKGRTEEAAPLLAEANKGMPDNAEVQYHYAALLAKQGKNSEAVALLRRAVAGKLPATAKADAEKLLQQLVK